MNDTALAQKMFEQMLSSYKDKIKASQANAGDEIREIVLDLSVARTRENALKVSFPFKSVFVEEASDNNVLIKMIPESDVAGRASINLRLLDAFNTEYGMSSCFLFWDEQPNKRMVLKFFTTSKIESNRMALDLNSTTDQLNVGNVSVDRKNVLSVGWSLTGTGVYAVTSLDKAGLYSEIGQNFYTVPEGYIAEILAIEGYRSPINKAAAVNDNLTLYIQDLLDVYATTANLPPKSQLSTAVAVNMTEGKIYEYNLLPRMQYDYMTTKTRVLSHVYDSGAKIQITGNVGGASWLSTPNTLMTWLKLSRKF